MLAFIDTSSDISHAIQLALAPVFLLSGIASLLSLMMGRLARIVDRGRYLTETAAGKASLSNHAIATELHALEHRRHFTSVAIGACALSALLVCLVVAMLFFEVLFGIHMRWPEGIVFITATVTLIIGLVYFLREVHLAMKSVRIQTST